MPIAVVLYHSYLNVEWGTKYYFEDGNFGTPVSLATALADAEGPLLSDSVLINRYEYFSPAGVKTAEGAMANTGERTGEIMPINYAIFVRLASGGPKRPSTKYLHGYTEDLVTDGEPNLTLSNAISAYGADLAAADVTDSDGEFVTGAIFRGFSRRRRLRRPL